MIASATPSTDPVEYRFGDFRLVPATRELWQRGERKHVQPLVFDCIVYLLEHRARAVGRDELGSAVWARADVGDQQIRQMVLRARQAIDDDAKEQRIIRTVPGGSYRWVMRVEATPLRADQNPPVAAAAVQAVPASAEPHLPHADAVPAEPDQSPPGAAASAGRFLPARRRHAFLGAVLLVFAGLLFYVLAQRGVATPRSVTAVSGQAVVVLPLDVTAPPEAGWVRLGAMDLIAHRLRSAGMPVSPSDSVVSALHAIGEPSDPGALAKLRETLGAGILVQGSATRSSSGWKVALSATAADETRYTAEVERPEAVGAAREATDMLLAALGRSVAPETENEHDRQQTLLQRARAALLANQLDTARSILTDAPESLRTDPRLRVLLAQVDQRSGRPDEAQASLRALLDDSALQAQPSTHASALTILGFIEMDRNDCVAGERNFDAALSVLAGRQPGIEAGNAFSARGSARACLGRVDEAIGDLSTAGPLLDAAGDRLGLANLDNRFAVLELYRGRPAEAVPYLQSASAIHQSFGAVNGLAADLSLLCMVQAELLQWTDALASSERLWALNARIDDAGRLYAMGGLRAGILVRTGQHGAATTLLRGIEAAKPDVSGPLTLAWHQSKAQLAWDLGDARQTLAELDAAWPLLPPAQMRDDEDLYTILLRQRASIAIGKPVQGGADLPARGQGGLPDARLSPALLVARAEWAAQQGQAVEAEDAFRQAMRAAEAHAVPANVVLAADAYARWLLAQHRSEDARSVAGRIAQWAERDYDSAVLQVAVFHALAQPEAWARALKRAQALAGERAIPAALLQSPGF